MTIKEMLKKVEGYNEVTQYLTIDPASLVFEDTVGTYTANREYMTTYKTFTKFINDNYFDEIADAILSFTGYEFGEAHTFDTGRMTATVTFTPSFKNR